MLLLLIAQARRMSPPCHVELFYVLMCCSTRGDQPGDFPETRKTGAAAFEGGRRGLRLPDGFFFSGFFLFD